MVQTSCWMKHFLSNKIIIIIIYDQTKIIEHFFFVLFFLSMLICMSFIESFSDLKQVFFSFNDNKSKLFIENCKGNHCCFVFVFFCWTLQKWNIVYRLSLFLVQTYINFIFLFSFFSMIRIK